MPVGLLVLGGGIYEAIEHHAKMGNSYRRSTCIDHLGPLGCEVQRDRNRQYALNQVLKYIL